MDAGVGMAVGVAVGVGMGVGVGMFVDVLAAEEEGFRFA